VRGLVEFVNRGLAGSGVGIPALRWWGYVLIAALVLVVAALVLPRVGDRDR
jgi:hypothetical protein